MTTESCSATLEADPSILIGIIQDWCYQFLQMSKLFLNSVRKCWNTPLCLCDNYLNSMVLQKIVLGRTKQLTIEDTDHHIISKCGSLKWQEKSKVSSLKDFKTWRSGLVRENQKASLWFCCVGRTSSVSRALCSCFPSFSVDFVYVILPAFVFTLLFQTLNHRLCIWDPFVNRFHHNNQGRADWPLQCAHTTEFNPADKFISLVWPGPEYPVCFQIWKLKRVFE